MRREILAPVTRSRCLREGFKRVEQSTNPAVGGIAVIRGDVFPDLLEIKLRIDAEDVAAHPRSLRRWSDLRRKRARAAAG
jgi:hypothetical protein